MGAGTANRVVMGLGGRHSEMGVSTRGRHGRRGWERPLSAYLYFLGSDNVSSMVAHQLNSSKALIQDLAVKDLALAKSSENLLDSLMSTFGFLMSTF